MDSILRRRWFPALWKILATPFTRAAQPDSAPIIRAIWFAFGWAALWGAVLFVQRLSTTTVISMQIAVREAAPGNPGMLPCFYYDTGHGFSEEEKVCFNYVSTRPDQFHEYKVALPTVRTARQLRFDPLQEPGVVALRDFRVGRYRTTSIDLRHEFGRTLVPVHGSSLSFEGETLVARLSTIDPYFILSNRLDRLAGFNAGMILRAAVLAFLISIGLVAVIVLDRWTGISGHAQGWLDPVRCHLPSQTAVLLAWAGLCGVILLVESLSAPTVSLEIAVKEAAPRPHDLMLDLFYDTGHGFNDDQQSWRIYDRTPVNQFQSYRITLPIRSGVRRVRFDPLAQPGVVAFRSVRISKYRTVELDLARELGQTLYPLKDSQLSLEGNVLVARMETDDPEIMLSDVFKDQTALDARAILNTVAIAFLICLAGVLLIAYARWSGIAAYGEVRLDALRHCAPALIASTRAVSLGALAVFLVAMLAAKLFAIATSAFRYGRTISLADLAVAPAQGVAIGLLALLAIWILTGADGVCARRRWTAPFRLLLIGFQLVIASVLVLLALFEVLCCYVFWEWGSFVDWTLIRVAYESPTPDSIRYYLTRLPALVAALAIVALAVFGVFAFRAFRKRGIPKRLVVAIASGAAVFSLAALSPLREPLAYDPSVSSPIFVALQRGTDLGEALDPGVTSPNLMHFHLPAPRPVPAAYQHYRGAAAGQDVIFVVFESVRRDDTSLYGYPRDTTPNLRRLADHAMVFSNAYISQPRSCKTMESFTLGTYPDPRYDSLTWDADRIIGRQSLWGTLAHNGYKAYLGVNADTEADGFGPFMRAALGPTLDRSMSLQGLVARYGQVARPAHTMGNDTVLVDDFLQWYRSRKGPSAAVIWFAEAHHPYWAVTKKFPEHNLVDQYDNCIYSADAAVGHLIDEIAKTGKHPLVLIFGDHGESFGEHAGDQFHGRYLYNQSVRIPMMLYDSALFPHREDFDGRFSIKDVPATMLYLLGDNDRIGQSEVIFAARPDDTVYMSNVYGDFKLGMVYGPGPEKFMYVPDRKQSFLFDGSADPYEMNNLVASTPSAEIQRREQQLLQWYFYQTAYLDKMFPSHPWDHRTTQ